MKRVTAALVLAGIGLWSAGAFAQGRNFAGTWTVDSEKTMAAAMATLNESVGAVARGTGGGGAVAGGRGGFGVAGAGGATPTMRSGGGGGGGGTMGAAGGRGRAGGGAAAPMSITLNGDTFSVTQGETTTDYRTDGSASSADTPSGRVTRKSVWKEDKLVIDVTTEGPNGPFINTLVWYLDGESLVRETHSPDGAGGTTVRKTYFKRA
jgi:hypothetical protein